MRAPPAEPTLSRLSYINDILCDEEVCEVIREDEKSRVANTSTKHMPSNTVHVRQVRFGGGGNVRVSSGGSVGGRKSFATVPPSSFGRDSITSPTPSVHFQVHPAPRSSPKKRYLFRLAVPYSTKFNTVLCKYRDNDGTMTFRGTVVAIPNKKCTTITGDRPAVT